MGMLSKKRKQPRIVKKNRNKNKGNKKSKTPSAITDSKLWSEDKTASRNYKEMGLVMNNKPSMRQSKVGQALLTEARVKMNPKHYEKTGIIDSDLEDNEQEDDKATAEYKPKADLTKVFP